MTTLNGIVLYSRPYKDHDLLVRMLTDQHGLRTFLARGAKRPKSKLSAGVQPFTLVTFEGALPKRAQGLGYFNDVQATTHFAKLTEDILTNAYATLIGNLLEAAYEDGYPIYPWYQQLSAGLQKMQAGFDPQIIANIFEIQLLVPLGVPINWREDPIDGHTDGEFDFSEKFNGILGANHYDLDEHRLHVDQKTMYYLRLFSVVDLHKVNSIKVGKPTKRSLQRVIDHIYERQIGLKPRSKQFIEQMQTWDKQISQLPPRQKGETS